MKINYKLIIGILLLVLIIFLIFRSSKEKTFNKINIHTTNMILNKTSKNYLDSIIYVGLNELYLDSIAVTIKEINPDIQKLFDSNSQLKAHIIGNNNQYIIFLDDMGRDEAIKVLSHELIHLQQYQTKKLILYKDSVYWDKKILNQDEINDLKYEDRPWEAEAFQKQSNLENKIREILY